ncbi:hypothetical protein [Sorangium sp. So ce1000]|uniref:hypothetical protein n=1 Tax=Sorangium sp. So ce1000 TaxID=3133325 RepID=UPI003F5EA571
MRADLGWVRSHACWRCVFSSMRSQLAMSARSSSIMAVFFTATSVMCRSAASTYSSCSPRSCPSRPSLARFRRIFSGSEPSSLASPAGGAGLYGRATGSSDESDCRESSWSRESPIDSSPSFSSCSDAASHASMNRSWASRSRPR